MAVHVLGVLAHKGGERVTSEFIAASVNTNPVIIRRLLLALQLANLVETRKGAGFGSRLCCPPNQITLDRIYRAVEDDKPFTMPRKKPSDECPVGSCIQKSLEKIFMSAQTALESELAKATLADILISVKRCEQKAKTAAGR